MTATPTHWLEYGEPVDGDRVQATKRVTYQTGPNEAREDDVTIGTLPMAAIEIWDESDHVHDDGTLMLSAVDDDTRDYLESVFEPTAPMDVEEEIDALTTAGLLTERQAEAFVYREVELVPRGAAADEMDIATSTLDDYVGDAKSKIQAAKDTIEAVDEIRYQAEGTPRATDK